MEITKFIVKSREESLLLDGPKEYWHYLRRRIHAARRKLHLTTPPKGGYTPKPVVTASLAAKDVALAVSERYWAQAMAFKNAITQTSGKAITGRPRSHIISHLHFAVRNADRLVQELAQTETSKATSLDVLEAQAYAALLHGVMFFEWRAWGDALPTFAFPQVVYANLSRAVKGDAFQETIGEALETSIRYASYQKRIPRTTPMHELVRQFFPASNAELVARVRTLDPTFLQEPSADDAAAPLNKAPLTITWRNREVIIEDAAIREAWLSVQKCKAELSEQLDSFGSLSLADKAAAYDGILLATQDAAEATKLAILDLQESGVPTTDPRLQNLQITRTATNYEMISWRIGRNRVLCGETDGSTNDFAFPTISRKRKRSSGDDKSCRKEVSLPKQVATLKERVALYDGVLGSLDMIKDLPGVAADEPFIAYIEALGQYFVALKSLAVGRSHALAGNPLNALALFQYALDKSRSSQEGLLTCGLSWPNDLTPPNIVVKESDVADLVLALQAITLRFRASVYISRLEDERRAKQKQEREQPLEGLVGQASVTEPRVSLMENLSRISHHSEVELDNLVPRIPLLALKSTKTDKNSPGQEAQTETKVASEKETPLTRLPVVPVKPIFLDLAWNYIQYPGKSNAQALAGEAAQPIQTEAEDVVMTEQKPKKRGWFGFGR